MYLFLGNKGFPVGVSGFRSDGYMLYTPVHWIGVLACLGASMRTPCCCSQSNLGILLLLTVKIWHFAATDNKNSAIYCYWQSKLDALLLLTNNYRFLRVFSLTAFEIVYTFKYHLMTMIMLIFLNMHLLKLACVCVYVWVYMCYVVCVHVYVYEDTCCLFVPDIWLAVP